MRTSLRIDTDYVCGHERDEDDVTLVFHVEVDEQGNIENFTTHCSQCDNEVDVPEELDHLLKIIKSAAQAIDQAAYTLAENKKVNCNGAEPWLPDKTTVSADQVITPQALERMIAEAAVIHNTNPELPDAFTI